MEYQDMFSVVILYALLFGSICFDVRLIFFYVFGGNPYFIKKSHIMPFDSAI